MRGGQGRARVAHTLTVRVVFPVQPSGESRRAKPRCARIDVVPSVRACAYFIFIRIIYYSDSNATTRGHPNSHTRAGVVTRAKRHSQTFFPLNKMYDPDAASGRGCSDETIECVCVCVFVQRPCVPQHHTHITCTYARVSCMWPGILTFRVYARPRKLKCQVKPDIWLSNDR